MIGLIKLITILVVPGFVATLTDWHVSESRNLGRSVVKFIMYAMTLGGMLFAVKAFFSGSNAPIVDAFIELYPLLGYMAFAVVAAVVLPLFINCRLPERVRDAFGFWSRHFISCYTVAAVLSAAALIVYHRVISVYNIGITVNHMLILCAVFVLSNLTLSAIVYILPSGFKSTVSSLLSRIAESVKRDDERPFMHRLGSATLVSLAFVFSVIVFIPYEIYLGNVGDFAFEFSKFWWIIAIEAVAVLAAMIVVELLFKGKAFNVVLSLVFGVTLAGYVQSMFLNGLMDTMTGDVATWSGSQVIVNLIIWIAVMLIPVAICLFFDKIWKGVCRFGSVLIIGMQIVALIGMMFVTETPVVNTRLVTDGLCEVSSGKNVIIFVLDRFDQRYIDRTKALYPDVYDRLHGFTYYPNTSGSYCFTHNAVPYLLTGNRVEEFDPTYEQYVEQMDTSKYWNYIVDNTGNVGIYTDNSIIKSETARDVITNCTPVEYKLNMGDITVAGLKSSLYRVSPFVMKNRFGYSATDFNTAVMPAAFQNVYDPNTSLMEANMLDDIQANGVRINESYGDSCFRFIHVQSTHEPRHLDKNGDYTDEFTSCEDVASGDFKLISEYLEDLHELGLYKDATVIITSDHGYNPVPTQQWDGWRYSNPIMFYKPAGADWGEGMRTLETPISHDDIFATVINALGGDGSQFGRAFEDIAEDEDRIRYFYAGLQDPDVTEYESAIHVEYKIGGDARDKNNWVETGYRVYPNNSPKKQNNS